MTMNEILALRQTRADKWEATKAFLASHQNENGMLSAEDEQTYARMEKEIVDLGKAIDRAEQVAAMDAKIQAPTSTRIVDGVNRSEEKTGRASHSYTMDMLNALRTNFREISNQLLENPDTAGGYLVPAEWDARLIEKLNEDNVMRVLGTKINTSGTHNIPIVATPPTASWYTENAPITFGSETFDNKALEAHKLVAAVKVSNELLYDAAYDLEAHLVSQFAKAIANKEEEGFIVGNGTNQPKGVLDATHGGTYLADLNNTTLTGDIMINLVYALGRAYRKNAAFLCHDSTLAAVRKLKDGTNQNYIWQPSLQMGEPDRLLGYPVYTSAYVPTLAAGNPFMAFGDFSYYFIGDRETRSIRRLNELFAGNDLTGFMLVERVDGVLVNREAVQILKVKAS